MVDVRLSLSRQHVQTALLEVSEETALVFGTLDQPKTSDGGLSFYVDRPEELDVVSGSFEAIHLALRFRTTKPGTVALRDFYPFWRQCGMGSAEPNGGKLLFIRNSEEVHDVFFDDNVECGKSKIIEVRDLDADGGIPGIGQLKDCHLCRAEPLESCQNPQ